MSRRQRRRRNRLTDRFVRTVTRPGKYSDGNGLFLQVYETGAKCWQQRYMINGRTRTLGLGGYPTVSLKKARKKSFKNLVLVSDGIDPFLEKHKKKAPTFAEACAIVVEIKRARWSNPREAHDWLRTFENYAYPYFGDKPVSKVEPGDVLESLLPIWTEKPTTAKKVRFRTGAVMKWAVTKGYLTTNPAGDVLDGGLPGRVKTENFPAVPYPELSGVVAAVHSWRRAADADPCLRVAGTDARAYLGSAGREVEGVRFRDQTLDDPGGAHEDEAGAQGSAFRPGTCRSPEGARVRRLPARRLGISFADGHRLRQEFDREGISRAQGQRGSSRVPFELS